MKEMLVAQATKICGMGFLLYMPMVGPCTQASCLQAKVKDHAMNSLCVSLKAKTWEQLGTS